MHARKGNGRMWLFTRYGFYSVVCARRGMGKRGEPVDPDLLQVRARARAHLEALQTRFPALQEFPIQAHKGTDYRYRLFVPKLVWVGVQDELARELDYDNFKAAAEAFQRQQQPGASGESLDYVQTLHQLWDILWEFQNRSR